MLLLLWVLLLLLGEEVRKREGLLYLDLYLGLCGRWE